MAVINEKVIGVVDGLLSEAGLQLDDEDKEGVLRALGRKFTNEELEALFEEPDERQIRQAIIKLRSEEVIVSNFSRMAHSVLGFFHCRSTFYRFKGHSLGELDANYFCGFYDFRVFQTDKNRYECFGEKADKHLALAAKIWKTAQEYHGHIDYRLARAAWMYYALSELGRHFDIDRGCLLDMAYRKAGDALRRCPESSRDFDQIEAVYTEVSRKWNQLNPPRL